MNFIRRKNRECFLHDTQVENIFINEYLPAAPGDYVKVFLFALMYSGYQPDINNENIAKHLGMEPEDVLKAWNYWEHLGIIKKTYKDKEDRFHYKVEFLNLKEKMYCPKRSKREKIKNEKALKLADVELKQLYDNIEDVVERVLEGRETEEILSWLTDYNMEPEVIIFGYKYAKDHRNQTRVNYVGSILKDWHQRNLFKLKDVEAFLADSDSRHYNYKRVMQGLGFMRNPTEAEKKMMDSWFDELGVSMEQVLDACGKTTGISNPNLNYVNSVLKGRNQAGAKVVGGSSSSQDNAIMKAQKHYEEVRKNEEEAAKLRKKEVYSKVPRIKALDEELRDIGLKISKSMILDGSADTDRIKELIRQQKRLNSEKAFLMTENNFVLNYIDIQYQCDKCKDTGILDNGQRCSCYAEILKKVEEV